MKSPSLHCTFILVTLPSWTNFAIMARTIFTRSDIILVSKINFPHSTSSFILIFSIAVFQLFPTSSHHSFCSILSAALLLFKREDQKENVGADLSNEKSVNGFRWHSHFAKFSTFFTVHRLQYGFIPFAPLRCYSHVPSRIEMNFTINSTECWFNLNAFITVLS